MQSDSISVGAESPAAVTREGKSVSAAAGGEASPPAAGGQGGASVVAAGDASPVAAAGSHSSFTDRAARGRSRTAAEVLPPP